MGSPAGARAVCVPSGYAAPLTQFTTQFIVSHTGKTPCDDAAILHGAPASPCRAAQQRWTLVAAILGSGMAFVDGTVVNVALPAIQHDLNADAFDAQWVIEAYALFLAALLLPGGALGDRFGRRRLFMTGVGLFTAASMACGASSTVSQLIAARAVQGIGAALLVPGSLALISTAYPQAQRGRAIGTWSAFSGITAAVGPVLGGFLVDHFSWAWAFIVNVPIGIVLLIVCAAKVPESTPRPTTYVVRPPRGMSKVAKPHLLMSTPRPTTYVVRPPRGMSEASGGRVDVWGALLATVGLAGIVFALIEAPGRGWAAASVVGAALAGVAGLVLFVVVEAKSRSPMLPLGLFRSRNFAGANVLTLLLYAALGGGLYFFPLNLIQVQGYGATAAGAAMLPFIAIMFALSRWAGQLVDSFGSKIPLVAGPTIAAAGFGLFAWPGIGDSYWLSFFPAVAVLGLGMTITVAPLTTTVMNAVGPDRAGVASGVNNAVSRTAALLAIAGFGALLAWAFDAALSDRLAHIEVTPDVLASLQAQRHKLAGLTLPAGIDEATASALRRMVGESFVAGFRWVMALCAALALLSALSAWLLIDGKPRLETPPARRAAKATATPV